MGQFAHIISEQVAQLETMAHVVYKVLSTLIITYRKLFSSDTGVSQG